MEKTQFSKDTLLRWINNDPYREANLIENVPIKATTLAKIKSGTYEPSRRMKNAFLAVMNKNERIR